MCLKSEQVKLLELDDTDSIFVDKFDYEVILRDQKSGSEFVDCVFDSLLGSFQVKILGY